MTDGTNDRWAYRRSLVAVIVANLFPFLGLVGLGWGLSDLLVVYWLEWGIILVVGMLKACPAKLVTLPLPDPRTKPLLRNRHGTVDIGDGTVTCYVRNVPTIAAQLAFLGVWTATGAALFWSASPLYYSSHETIGSVAGVAGLLALVHVLQTSAYFDAERYDRISGKNAAGAASVHTFGMLALFAVLLDWGWSSGGTVVWPSAVPYAIVGGKLGIELLVHTRRWQWFRGLDADTDPFDYEHGFFEGLSHRGGLTKFAELPRVTRPATRPRATVRPSRSSVAKASPILGALDPYMAGLFTCSVGFAILFAVTGLRLVASLTALAIGIALLAVPTLVRSLPRHATLEYELYDDRLVCYDRWLEEPVWNLPYDDVESVSVERGIAARFAGYGTVVLETTDDRPARLPYLRDYRDVADRLERTAESDDRSVTRGERTRRTSDS